MRCRAEQIAAALLGALLLGLLTSSYWPAPLPAKASGLARQERPTIPPDRPTVPPPSPTVAPPTPTEAPPHEGDHGHAGDPGEGGEHTGEEHTGADEPGHEDDAAADLANGAGDTGAGNPGTAEEAPAKVPPEALPATLPSTGGAGAGDSLLAALGILALAVGLTLRRAL